MMTNDELLDSLINGARRTWEDLNVERDDIFGVEGGTFDPDANLVVLRAKAADDRDGLLAVTADEFLLFALRILNKRFESALLAKSLPPKGGN